MKVFFYGSLMRKFPRRIFDSPSIVHIKDDTIKGVMHSLGRFPAVVEGDGVVKGEVCELVGDGAKDMLRRLDMFEGYTPTNRASSMYTRETVLTGSGEEVQVYIYNGKPSSPAIPDGDWLNFCEGENRI